MVPAKFWAAAEGDPPALAGGGALAGVLTTGDGVAAFPHAVTMSARLATSPAPRLDQPFRM